MPSLSHDESEACPESDAELSPLKGGAARLCLRVIMASLPDLIVPDALVPLAGEASESGRSAFALAVDPAAERSSAASPFAQVDRDEWTGRMVFGRLLGPGRGSIAELVLEIETDEAASGAVPGWTNVEREALWERRWRETLAAAELGIAPRVVDWFGRRDSVPRLAPILHCREAGDLFAALCPRCSGPLGTCRDDSFLAEQGLPSFSGAGERFLYCVSCAANGEPAGVFEIMPTNASRRDNAQRARSAPELYAEFRGLLSGQSALPCIGCEGVPECYPESGEVGAVVSRLTPLSFQDFACIPYERFHFTCTRFARALGGSESCLSLPSEESAEQRDPGRRYLFEADPEGKLALEIFRLKLLLFEQAVEQSARMHREFKRPHLGLSPENVVVAIRRSVGVPLFYSFSTYLVGFGGSVPIELAGSDIDLFKSVDGRNSSEERLGDSTDLSITDVVASESGGYMVEAALPAALVRDRRLGAMDLLRASIRQSRPFPLSLDLVGVCTTAGDASQGRFRSTEVSLDRPSAEYLSELRTPLKAALSLTRSSHVTDDVRALGALLVEILFANAPSGASSAVDAVGELAKELESSADGGDLDQLALQGLRQLESAGTLARRHLVERPEEWGQGAGEIPDAFWIGGLKIALRAMVQAPGFGICRGRDDFDRDRPEGPAERLRVEVSMLAHKIETELLGLVTPKTIIDKALRRVRAELDDGDDE